MVGGKIRGGRSFTLIAHGRPFFGFVPTLKFNSLTNDDSTNGPRALEHGD